jgi:hypothetical protein
LRDGGAGDGVQRVAGRVRYQMYIQLMRVHEWLDSVDKLVWLGGWGLSAGIR